MAAIVALPSDQFNSFPEFCSWIQHIPLPSSFTIVGLTDSGRLYSGSHLICTDATSYTFTADFLIYTTFSHEAKFITLTSLERIDSNPIEVYHTETMKKDTGIENGGDLIKRTVERGSRIVTVVPSSTTLVLQMPRGNIETIYPRPLVLQIVRQDLDLCVFSTTCDDFHSSCYPPSQQITL
jgi:elongator complex protein 1